MSALESLKASYQAQIDELVRLRESILEDMRKERAAVRDYYDTQILQLRQSLEDIGRLDLEDD